MLYTIIFTLINDICEIQDIINVRFLLNVIYVVQNYPINLQLIKNTKDQFNAIKY